MDPNDIFDIISQTIKLQKDTEELQISTIKSLLDIADRNDIPFDMFPMYVTIFTKHIFAAVNKAHSDCKKDHQDNDTDDNGITNVEIDM